jgi:hypothetical protein
VDEDRLGDCVSGLAEGERLAKSEGGVLQQGTVFVANPDSDPMILPHYSYLGAGLVPRLG